MVTDSRLTDEHYASYGDQHNIIRRNTEGAIGALYFAYLVVLGLQPQYLAVDL
jgi:hypothetical protein